tara:strand:+ start:1444 stop:2115 length:672 start_codon:yes stop_codon:yes gene_type:complete
MIDKKNYLIPDHDFLPEKYFIPIRNFFESHHPAWKFDVDTNSVERDTDAAHGGQFYTYILKQKEKDHNKKIYTKFSPQIQTGAFKLIIPLLDQIQNHFPKGMYVHPIRIKCNLRYRRKLADKTLPHVDKFQAINSNFFSAVYYLDNSDGNTILFKEFAETSSDIDVTKLNVLAKVKPHRNRIVIFHSSRVHAGLSPALSDTRRIINLVFEIKKDPYTVSGKFK